MSALQIPPAPGSAPTGRPGSAPSGRPGSDDTPPTLRLVEPLSRPLAPSGPLQAWRRRIRALLLVVAAVVLLVEAVDGPTTASTDAVPATATTAATAVVAPGQTLWDVASEHAPADVGTAAYVRELAELNGITNGAVEAWQVLRLPAG